MKLLTLAVAIALLGIFGCDEPNQMMQQVTRETGEIGETGETAPTAGDVIINQLWNGEVYCPDPYWCDPVFSYTNVPGEDNTGQVTIYVDIPEVVSDGPHTVHLTWDPDRLELDIPNQRLAEFPEDDFKRMESTFFLKRGDTIVFKYEWIHEELLDAWISVWYDESLEIRDEENVTEGNVEWAAEPVGAWSDSLEALEAGGILIVPSTE